jgi:hypothetical protein
LLEISDKEEEEEKTHFKQRNKDNTLKNLVFEIIQIEKSGK